MAPTPLAQVRWGLPLLMEAGDQLANNSVISEKAVPQRKEDGWRKNRRWQEFLMTQRR